MSIAPRAREGAREPTGPTLPRSSAGDVRGYLAQTYLRGSGVEIGALHLAMPMPPGTRVRYVDRMAVEDLRDHYPELRDWDLAAVDVVDDGERLETIEPESVDFIVANHFLEHCQDPISTITTHLSKLRPGGTLFYAVPDKRYTFDFRRDRTRLQHVIDDHEQGAQRSRAEHYLQWTTFVHEGPPPSPEQAAAEAQRLDAEDYSIHFHVWTAGDLTELILHIQDRLGIFEIETIRRNGIENILVLRKHGDIDSWPQNTSAPPFAVSASPASPALRHDLGTDPLPLAALRARLDPEAEVASFWSVDPDGVTGRALVMSSGHAHVTPLRLPAALAFRCRVRLLPHDWRDGRGSIHAHVRVTTPEGEQELWSGPVASASDGGSFEGTELECELPVATSSLRLVLEPHVPGERAVARALWVEPALIGAGGSPVSTCADLPSPAARRRDETPRFSVLTPVHDPSLTMLRAAVDSVVAQSFDDWELCLLDDGSQRPEIVDALRGYAEADSRIRLERREHAGGIADATNAAMAMARGEYLALLDHDDWLGPDALAAVATRLEREPELDMIYTDEDIVLDDTPVWTHLKPGWSPDTLRTNGYTCHLGVYRRSLVLEIGGFRTEFNGSQDVDMILRLIERTDRVAHVPGVHYHWRIHPDSTAGGDAKPYAYVAARRAIAEHLERAGIDADVQYGPPGLYRVVHRVPEACRVALVLAIEDAAGILEASATWMAQPHRSWHVVLAGPESVLAEAMGLLRRAGVSNHRIRSLICEDMDRHSALAVAGADARADTLVLMQTPAAGLSHDWLTRITGYARQHGVGAAGPLQFGPGGRIQEGGVVMPNGWPLPLLQGAESSMDAHFGYGTSVYDVTAVSGMLATTASTFSELGGLRPELAELSLVEYCLRAGDAGLRTVLVPDARLQITGHDRTMNDLERMSRLQAERGAPQPDPLYNPLFLADRGDLTTRR